MTIDAFIAGMPKCELHVHLEGTLEPELKFALAKRNAIALKEPDVAAMRASYRFRDLASFLAIYYDGMRVLLTEEDFYGLTMAYLMRVHGENVVYTEMFFDPEAHTARGIAFDTVIRGIRRAQMEAETRLGIRSALILCFLRDWSAEFAMATLVQSLPYKEWILGIGLDSDERDNPPLKFRAVFRRARAEGYLLTAHCDPDQKDTTEHIRQCLDEIEVARIDHGVNTLDDPALIEKVRAKQLGLTICPISNFRIYGDSKAADIKRLLDLGIRATVNSDDPAYFGGYMTDNLITVARDAKLERGEIVQLMENAFEAAWLPRTAKERYLTALHQFAAS
ncbi:MAG: adenosine deaminase [Stellaceae bacterium]